MGEETEGPGERPALRAALNDSLRSVCGQNVAYRQAVAARLGLSSSDLDCLGLVAARGPITAGALAEATGLTSGAITGVIDRLERAGYAVRVADPADRRKVLVRVSPAAAARVAPLFEPLASATHDSLAAYNVAELRMLLGFLERTEQAGHAALARLRDLPRPDPKRVRP